ncbi:MAG: trifunctional transcriptional regulator/proline dehydrogenase/L-glutamate gamma-semialdehyde dehydrogenase [Thiotrichales bacterium]|nr:trifunctional transcriptional regulator/proline dehydrogenase/L-glutamate gamma-semialdehyde dehydrogenase [Thiotrichales bacterium]
MLFDARSPESHPQRAAIDDHYRCDETRLVRTLLDELADCDQDHARAQHTARGFVQSVRERSKGGLDAFLHEYGLSTHEGVMLMCIAEALLRIPDDETQEALIRDKISAANWDRHLGHSDSVFVNASTWALMLTGRVVGMHALRGQNPGGVLRRLVARVGEPVIREAVIQAMRIMGRQFVMGRTIEEGLERAAAVEAKGYRYSYDMLGEAARTLQDSDRFFEAYKHAIATIGAHASGRGVVEGAGISVKLSALHPRYELWQKRRVMDELVPRMQALAASAAQFDIGLNIDAEEAARLDISLDVIEAVSAVDEHRDWQGLGVVVQAYQKRAPFVIDWLVELAHRHRRRLMVRLVKGAYWDTEVKLAQELALDGYPVFTRKVNTDVCYLACARKLLAARDVLYPQFATHNAHTIASILAYAGDGRGFEFQRLHGMGGELYEEVVESGCYDVACRIYAPVGQHEDLLAYLVRRLLENGANSSFVNRIQDEALPVEEIVADPVTKARGLAFVPHPKILLPVDLYGARRRNFAGADLTDRLTLGELARQVDEHTQLDWVAGPLVGGELIVRSPVDVESPADRTRIVGSVTESNSEDIERALALAAAAAPGWGQRDARERAACLYRLGDLMENHQARLMAMAIDEAGKTVNDALAEIREAVDFCRYYALQAETVCERPERLRAPREQGASVALRGGTVFCCISPWNFPLAIFCGQIVAALAAGNAVLAKPAEQTSIIATAAVQLMHEAGVPGEVVQLLPGEGARVGGALVVDPRVGGVCFTGSTEVAQVINRTLCHRPGPMAPLIAETGGLNAMIVDSSALPEQVTRDVIMSAFQSAGQRCSALRVLCLQEDVADDMIEMLKGAMEELCVGDPRLISTDVGPVIDTEAQETLDAHVRRMRGEARLIKQTKQGPGTGRGSFVSPVAFELDSLDVLEREVFGPVLHVVRFRSRDLDALINRINAFGYGLTHGIHTRVDETRDRIIGAVRAGNIYVNRNQIGAVVGVQPFGGEALSGTGPKAGGPGYVPRFCRQEPVYDAVTGEAPATLESVLSEVWIDGSAVCDWLHASAANGDKWSRSSARHRASVLEKLAEYLERGRVPGCDSRQAERASDYLHFYAAQFEAEFSEPLELPGPTGEDNRLWYPARGVVACLCLRPDPVAFVTQLGAALVTGNTVLGWYPDRRAADGIIAAYRQAGVTDGALQLIGGAGTDSLVSVLCHGAIAAVSMTGSSDAQRALRTAVAEQPGPIRPVIPHVMLREGDPPRGEAYAGSTRYLHRLTLERAISIDTTASGGNASLFSLE